MMKTILNMDDSVSLASPVINRRWVMRFKILVLLMLAALLSVPALAAETECCSPTRNGKRSGWLPEVGAVSLGRGETSWDLVIPSGRGVAPEEYAPPCCPEPESATTCGRSPAGACAPPDLCMPAIGPCPPASPAAARDTSCCASAPADANECQTRTRDKGCNNADCR